MATTINLNGVQAHALFTCSSCGRELCAAIRREHEREGYHAEYTKCAEPGCPRMHKGPNEVGCVAAHMYKSVRPRIRLDAARLVIYADRTLAVLARRAIRRGEIATLFSADVLHRNGEVCISPRLAWPWPDSLGRPGNAELAVLLSGPGIRSNVLSGLGTTVVARPERLSYPAAPQQAGGAGAGAPLEQGAETNPAFLGHFIRDAAAVRNYAPRWLRKLAQREAVDADAAAGGGGGVSPQARRALKQLFGPAAAAPAEREATEIQLKLKRYELHVAEYMCESLQRANVRVELCQHPNAICVVVAIVATVDIACGDELFIHLGEKFWANQAQRHRLRPVVAKTVAC
jgi:hypothetical protein